LLSVDDVDEIFELYTLGRSVTPFGFLAIRTKDDFREIFRRSKDVIGVGIRDNGQLIAYSICHRIVAIPYADNAILQAINPTYKIVYHGDGTVVHPDYQGRLLTKRLFRSRAEQLNERHADHMLGLVAVNNLVSIGNSLLAGALLIGFADDETAMNYIVYIGRLRDSLQIRAKPIVLNWQDHIKQMRLFAERHVVYDLGRAVDPKASLSNRTGDRQFWFCPLDPAKQPDDFS
jgi:GNAT superfamily N-acetyltransferase